MQGYIILLNAMVQVLFTYDMTNGMLRKINYYGLFSCLTYVWTISRHLYVDAF